MFRLKRPWVGLAIAVVLVAITPLRAMAKGDPTLATIEGPGLPQALRLTDTDLLALLNPWIGEFADWKDGLIESPPDLGGAYQLLVYVPIDESSGTAEFIYAFFYHPAPGHDRGLVYVPGPGEEWHTRNIATIVDGRDGEWHPAAFELDQALRPIIEAQITSDSAEGGSLSGMPMIVIASILAAMLVAGAVLARSLMRSDASA